MNIMHSINLTSSQLGQSFSCIRRALVSLPSLFTVHKIILFLKMKVVSQTTLLLLIFSVTSSLAGFEDPCTTNEECSDFVENSFCDVGTSKCECSPSFAHHESSREECGEGKGGVHTCLPVVATPFISCNVDEQCQGQFGNGVQVHCNEAKFCECSTPTDVMVELGRNWECLPKATKLNDKCDFNNQCLDLAQSFCDVNISEPKCLCSTGWAEGQKRGTSGDLECFPKATKLGDTCSENDNQCESLTDAKCIQDASNNYKCECKDSPVVPQEDRKGCLPLLAMSQVCKENA